MAWRLERGWWPPQHGLDLRYPLLTGHSHTVPAAICPTVSSHRTMAADGARGTSVHHRAPARATGILTPVTEAPLQRRKCGGYRILTPVAGRCKARIRESSCRGQEYQGLLLPRPGRGVKADDHASTAQGISLPPHFLLAILTAATPSNRTANWSPRGLTGRTILPPSIRTPLCGE